MSTCENILESFTPRCIRIFFFFFFPFFCFRDSFFFFFPFANDKNLRSGCGKFKVLDFYRNEPGEEEAIFRYPYLAISAHLRYKLQDLFPRKESIRGAEIGIFKKFLTFLEVCSSVT